MRHHRRQIGMPGILSKVDPVQNGQVVKVVDGDTTDVLTTEPGADPVFPGDSITVRVRLHGIDVPERGQPFGNNARDYLKELIAGEDVTVRLEGTDRYSRTIGYVYHDPCMGDPMCDGTLDVNYRMTAVGLAWRYVRFAPDDEELATAEAHARDNRHGLWAGSHKPIPPWEWRKLSKEERDRWR